MKKGKMIVTLAVVSALGLGGQALAQPDELEVNIDAQVDVNSNNTTTTDNSQNIELEKKVEVNKPEAEAEGFGNAAAVNGSTAEVTDNSKSFSVDDVTIDKSEKQIDIDKVEAERGSVASLKGDAINKENEAENGSAAALNGDAANLEAEYGAVAAIGGNASKEEVDGDIDNVSAGSAAASTGGTASISNSNNLDNSINANAEEGSVAANAGNDAIINTTEESYNNKAQDHSAAAYNGDAYAQQDFNNTTNSNNTTTTLTIGDVDVEIASSVLEGTVSSNVAPTEAEDVPLTGYNEINDSLDSPSGITVLSQNTGFSSLVQQSVNVQVNRQ